MNSSKITTALISVSDKTDLIPMVEVLMKHGITILSTGGTADLLTKNNLPVIKISSYTGQPEILGGRVKTLHPKIHAGLLARQDHSGDQATLEREQIKPIDLVIVNLYPFQKTIEQAACTVEQAVEQIDIGGPTMIRAGAKNYKRVAVVVDPMDYKRVAQELDEHQGHITENTKQELSQKAFVQTAYYEAAIANYFTHRIAPERDLTEPPLLPLMSYKKSQSLNYGENPHQKAYFYTSSASVPGSTGKIQQLQGKALSYNNLVDTDAALSCVQQFNEPACVIVKHANPCGVAVADDILSAYERAFRTDPASAFGGIIAFNRTLDVATARKMIAQQFVEIIVAPSIDPEVRDSLKSKPKIRLLACQPFTERSNPPRWHYQSVNGGLLVQEADTILLSDSKLVVATRQQPTEQQVKDLKFAWKVAKMVKSNAIVLAKLGATVGMGAGQMSRIDSTRLAIEKAQIANLSTQDAVMASDAFFPFADNIKTAAQAGVKAVIQPGGSIRDAEVVEAADRLGLVMMLTGIRHFKHS